MCAVLDIHLIILTKPRNSGLFLPEARTLQTQKDALSQASLEGAALRRSGAADWDSAAEPPSLLQIRTYGEDVLVGAHI